MDEPSVDLAREAVSSLFSVTSMAVAPAAAVFEVEGGDARERFVALARRLERSGMACKLERRPGGLRILVSEIPARGGRRWASSPHLPRALFAAVVCLVMVDGYYRTEAVNGVVDIGDPLETAAVYTLCLLGILGVHELGHIAASRAHRVRTSWPYFIPGVPVLGIPTFGALIRSRGLTINRPILFDIAMAGPVAGLAVTVAVSVYGAYEAPVLGPELRERIGEELLDEWGYGEPLLMRASFAAFGKGAEDSPVIMTPVLFAAWVGYLLTFLNMLPAWQLDGGHMARTLMGARLHSYATYASMGVLALLGYYFMALFILVLSSRRASAEPLDDVSPLGRGRRAAYAGVAAAAVLCAPLPAWLSP